MPSKLVLLILLSANCQSTFRNNERKNFNNVSAITAPHLFERIMYFGGICVYVCLSVCLSVSAKTK